MKFVFIVAQGSSDPYGYTLKYRRDGQIMECRVGCGACCIAASISSYIPGMPEGKPAGVRCVQLTPDNRCKLFGKPERPEVCKSLKPSEEMCGLTRQEAYDILAWLETVTAPDKKEESGVKGKL